MKFFTFLIIKKTFLEATSLETNNPKSIKASLSYMQAIFYNHLAIVVYIHLNYTTLKNSYIRIYLS